MLTFAEYSQAWDFRNTVAGQLQVDAYYNASKDPNAGNSSPLAVHVNQVGFKCLVSHTIGCIQPCHCNADRDAMLCSAGHRTEALSMLLFLYKHASANCKCFSALQHPRLMTLL